MLHAKDWVAHDPYRFDAGHRGIFVKQIHCFLDLLKRSNLGDCHSSFATNWGMVWVSRSMNGKQAYCQAPDLSPSHLQLGCPGQRKGAQPSRPNLRCGLNEQIIMAIWLYLHTGGFWLNPPALENNCFFCCIRLFIFCLYNIIGYDLLFIICGELYISILLVYLCWCVLLIFALLYGSLIYVLYLLYLFC